MPNIRPTDESPASVKKVVYISTSKEWLCQASTPARCYAVLYPVETLFVILSVSRSNLVQWLLMHLFCAGLRTFLSAL